MVHKFLLQALIIIQLERESIIQPLYDTYMQLICLLTIKEQIVQISMKGGACFALCWHLMGGAVAHVRGVVLN